MSDHDAIKAVREWIDKARHGDPSAYDGMEVGDVDQVLALAERATELVSDHSESGSIDAEEVGWRRPAVSDPADTTRECPCPNCPSPDDCEGAALVARRYDLENALRDLLEHAERMHGGAPDESEHWYTIRDYTRILLKA
jgi:hypothetical protein